MYRLQVVTTSKDPKHKHLQGSDISYLICPGGMLNIKCIIFLNLNQAEIQLSQSHITIENSCSVKVTVL